MGLQQIEDTAYPGYLILLILKQLCTPHGDFINLIFLSSPSWSSDPPRALDVILFF